MPAAIDAQFGFNLLDTGQPELIGALYDAAPLQACQIRPLCNLMRRLYHEGGHRRAIAIYNLMEPRLSAADRMSLNRFAAEHFRHVKDYAKALTMAREVLTYTRSSQDAREHARLIELYCLKCLWMKKGSVFLREDERALVRAWLRGDAGCRLTQSSTSYLRWQAWRVFVSGDGFADINVVLPPAVWLHVANQLREGLGTGNSHLQADVRKALEYLNLRMSDGVTTSAIDNELG